jgi:hypothetical protein
MFLSVHPREGGDPVLWAKGQSRPVTDINPTQPASQKNWVPAFAGMHGI